MLSLWRRHLADCKPGQKKGRAHTGCNCPVWCDGEVDGVRVRKSLDTRDWQRAGRKLSQIEDPSYGLRPCGHPGCNEMVASGRCARHTREIPRAIAAYHDAHQDAAESTKRSRRRTLRNFEEFITARGLKAVDEIELEHLNAFRTTRPISARTWVKELEHVRHFFRFCVQNDWILKSYADLVPMPRNLQVADREPYTPNEVARIIAACNQIGRGAYERLRARAMILLLRYTALRIGDVAMMERSRIQGGRFSSGQRRMENKCDCPFTPTYRPHWPCFPFPAARMARTAPICFGAATGRDDH